MKPKSPIRSAAPLEAHVGFWLRFVSNHVSVRFQQLLAERGVSVTEWVALRTMLDQRENSHATLIRALGMTKGAASKVVSRLEEKGLVQRRLVEGQARDQSLVLTDQGRALIPQLAALADANDRYFFGQLDVAERAALMRTLQTLVEQHGLRELPTA